MTKIISFAKNRFLEGHCEFNEAQSSLTGWARDCDAPNTNLQLDIRIDGNHFQTIEANQRSHGLEQEDPANSYHGFNLSLPRERAHDIDVAIVESSSGLEVPGSPILITATMAQDGQQI